MRRPDITPLDIREWVEKATDSQIRDLLLNGLESLVEELEDEDFFGTEGFNQRFR